MITRIRIDAVGLTGPEVDAEIAGLEGLIIQSGLISPGSLAHAHIVEEVTERVCSGNNIGDRFKGRRTTSFLP